MPPAARLGGPGRVPPAPLSKVCRSEEIEEQVDDRREVVVEPVFYGWGGARSGHGYRTLQARGFTATERKRVGSLDAAEREAGQCHQQKCGRGDSGHFRLHGFSPHDGRRRLSPAVVVVVFGPSRGVFRKVPVSGCRSTKHGPCHVARDRSSDGFSSSWSPRAQSKACERGSLRCSASRGLRSK